MRVAGFGFRAGASVESLCAALDAASGGTRVDVIATVDSKVDALVALTLGWGLKVASVPVVALKDQPVLTQSAKSDRLFGTGSLSEAAALWVAGEGANLVSARVISPDRMATCAIAEKAER